MDIFCKIVKGEIPSSCLYEDDIVKVIMDVPTFSVVKCSNVYFLLKIGFSFRKKCGILLLYRKYSGANVFRSFQM